MCVHVCVFFLIIFALNALSICAVFRQCTCQDVSSCDSAPVKMCHLRAEGLVCVCVHVCVFFLFISALNDCQDVSSFDSAPVKMCRLWARGCVCVCFLYYFSPKCIVKMCRLSAMHLSRCVVFGQGVVCVCAFFIISALNALSRCVVFRQCTCQDVSSLGKGLCVCVCSSLLMP